MTPVQNLSKSIASQSAKEGLSEEYFSIVQKYFSDLHTDDLYINVGKPDVEQGWLLHITIVPSQMEELLTIVLPALANSGFPFKVIRSRNKLKNLNSGIYGNFKIGKAITIYMCDEEKIQSLVEQLMILTETFIGPVPLTDFKLHNILYTRYGSFVSKIDVDAFENRSRIIHDAENRYFLDQYFVPPVVMPGISIPFLSFIKSEPVSSKVFLIAEKYMPVKLLKSDAKGNVWKALYFHKWLIPKWCVVKEGKSSMFPDEFGRDIRSRIHWQYKVSEGLSGSLPMPKMLECIDSKNLSYLVTGYIRKGRELTDVVYSLMKKNAWPAQPVRVKTEILGYLQQIVRAISKMHENGYVHQDITGTNFLVTARGKVKMIDLELAYCVTDRSPNPPFGIGTPGFMSPQQSAEEGLPIAENDIYSIGALMILLFTGGISPSYIVEDNKDGLKDRLDLIIENDNMVDLILQCLSHKPADRPDTGQILKKITDYSSTFKTKDIQKTRYPTIERKALIEAIEQSLSCIGGDQLTHEGVWYSAVENSYGNDVYPMGDKHVFSGLYRGVGGVIWTIYQLKQIGYNASKLDEKIAVNLEQIKTSIESHFDILSPSAYYGKAGLAITLTQSIKNGYLPYDNGTIEVIEKCFEPVSSSLDLLYGVAGQGIALMQCQEYIGKEKSLRILEVYLAEIIEKQQKDGSWIITHKIHEKGTGFGYGIAGIIYFLLEFGKSFHRPNALATAMKGLDYLQRNAIRRSDFVQWQNSDKDKTIGYWWCKGAPGIALTLLKAYSILKDSKYLELAEMALLTHPRKIVHNKLSQCHGLSGLGEIYLEAFTITGNKEWWDRAEWIAHLIISLKRSDKQGTAYWLVEKSDLQTADFMIGNSGVLHFLARFAHPTALKFPLLY